MAWEYSEKTKELFMAAVHGEPGTHLGEIDDPDGMGEHGSIACGDAMRFTFRVKRHPTDPLQDIVTEAKYLTFGCTSAIAASEALCLIIEAKNCTPIEALEITNQDIVDFLDGLPDQKIHCSVMGAEALESAVFNWAQRRGVNLQELGVDIHTEEQEEGRVVCKCFSLTEPYIKRKIKELALRSIPEIVNAIKAGGACMSCHHTPGGLQDLLEEVWKKEPGGGLRADGSLPIVTPIELPELEGVEAKRSDADRAELSPYQFSKKVEQVIDEQVRPVLQRDGGDIEIIDIKDLIVYCRLQGACANCAGAVQTMKYMVEQPLKDFVDERIRMIQV